MEAFIFVTYSFFIISFFIVIFSFQSKTLHNKITVNFEGLEKLHQITKSGLFSLRVDLEDFEENKAYAKYK